MKEIKHSLEEEYFEPNSTHKTQFYPGQKILWHTRHKVLGPGKFKI